jgi:hypothetical protein
MSKPQPRTGGHGNCAVIILKFYAERKVVPLHGYVTTAGLGLMAAVAGIVLPLIADVVIIVHNALTGDTALPERPHST